MFLRVLTVLATFAIAAGPALAGIHGILSGKVVDKDKKPLSGATVRVLGTTKGGITKANGKFTIVNIVAGSYDVRVTAVGYDTVTKNVRINADQTVSVDFTLTQGGGKLMADVVIQGNRELVRSTDVGTDRVLDTKALTSVSRDNVASALSLQAGITASGNSFVVRGSRTTETQVLVDGLAVTDQFTGGLGNSGATVSAAMPSPYATEQVQAKTGGFGAEYGNATGGVVNTVVRTGRDDRFEGLLAWRKDVPFLFGKAGNGVESGYPLEDLVDVTFSGPLGLGGSTFFVAVRNTYQNHRNFDLQVMDPIGNNLGLPPNNRTWSRNITGRMRFEFTPQLTMLVGGMYGLVNGERHGWGWLYANDEGVLVDNAGLPILDANGNAQTNGIPTRNAKQIVVQEFSDNAFAQINHQLGMNTFYELRVSVNGKTTETGRRKNADQPDLFTGWELYYPVDNLSISDTLYVEGPNSILDAYDYIRTTRRTEDGLLNAEVTAPNPLTGYTEGPADAYSTANPYGLINYFVARGNEGGVDLRRARFVQVDGNITSNLEVGETRHVFKAGVEMRFMTLSRHFNANPWDGSPFFDVYGSDYGGNLYLKVNPELPYTQIAKDQSEKPYTPITGGLFVQDQIMFKGLVFTPGLRFDYLSTDALYRTQYDRFYPYGSEVGFSKADPKLYVSPRMTITYPITERQNVRLAYGIYYMAPPFAEFYDSFNAVQLRGSQSLGNPNLEMQRTNQYEVSYNHQLNDDLALTATGFYKDIYNQSGLAFVRITPIPFYQRVLSDYGTARGVELTLQKRTIDNWGFNLNYTLQSATGTANNSGTAAAIDPQTEEPALPIEPFPLGFDRRHRFNAVVNFEWNEGEGPRIGGIPFMERFSVNFSGFWQTGLPYTPVDGRGQAAGQLNSARFPSNWNSELRIIRTIPLSGIFGGNTSMDVYMDFFNLLNYTGAIAFYPRTGSPDNDGAALLRQPGDFPATAYFKTGDPGRKETFSTAQYDRVGRRLYNERVDFNRDGIQTPDETYRGYQEYVATVVSLRGNYQDPRSVYFGVRFRF